MNNTNRYSKVYGRRKSRKRYFNPAATTVLTAHIIPAESNSSTTTTTSTTNLSQLERLPFSNINNNQRRLSEESGIYGGKIAKLARPVKHVFDLDSDSDEDLCGDSFPTTHTPTNGTATSTISAECSVGTNTVEKLSSPIQYNKPFDEFAVRTVFKPVATSTTKSDAVSPMAKKTLCLSSTPNETHEHFAAALSTAATPTSAAPILITKNITEKTIAAPKLQHIALSRPIIPKRRRRRPSKRAPLSTVSKDVGMKAFDEIDEEDDMLVFDLETLSMLPRPKSNKPSNILAVKVAALARQRVRAQRNSTSINRLRRSSIMPGRRSSTARGDRYSTASTSGKRLCGGSVFGSFTDRDTSMSSRQSTNKYYNSLNSTKKSRRSSILGGTAPSSPLTSRKSTVHSSATNRGQSRRSSSTIKTGTSMLFRSSSIFQSGNNGNERRISLVGGYVAKKSSIIQKNSASSSMHELEFSLAELKLQNNEHKDVFEEEDEDYDITEYAEDEAIDTLPTEEDDDDSVVFIDVAAALQFVLEFLTMEEMRKVTMFVDSIWSRSTISSMSWSIGNNVVQPNYNITRLTSCKLNTQYQKFQQTFPWGQFLCRGGFKSVYKVYCRHRQRMEAISVMDVNMIRSTNNQHIVRQEVHIGTLLSDLVTSGISPNFIETYGMFQTEMKEPDHLWGTESNKKPRGPFSQHSVMKFNPKKYKSTSNDGDYCYIRMELCDGGDFEEFLKERTNGLGVMPLKETIGALFQMISSLNLAQVKFNLRHYDVKLLNFFLKKKLSLTNDEDEMVEVAKYNYGHDDYIVESSRDYAYVVKLADYGTADTSIESLNTPIDDTNFATLENTPPDFLLLGNQALQTFAADTFALGLSAVHLLTGDMPYEEILEDVYCPSRLRREWTQIWQQNDQYEPLLVILGINNSNNIDYTLHDTLYRYFVLFGFPSHDEVYDYTTNPILRSVKTCYRLNSETYNEGKGNAWRSYVKDRQKYGFIFNDLSSDAEGITENHPLIARGRKRMNEISGMKDLVSSLCHYNPEKRVTMEDAIQADVFEILRV